MGACKGKWSIRVNWKTPPLAARTPEAARVAALFGLEAGRRQVLYEGFRLDIRPGEIVAVVGPSGAGKSVLLREAQRQVPGAQWLDAAGLARCDESPVEMLTGGDLPSRLAMLSRCGLAEAPAMIAPVKCLSGGQQYRAALAEALFRQSRRNEPGLLLADEFAATLDLATAANLCRNIRKLVSRPCDGPASAAPRRGGLALLLATPRAELLPFLRPDRIVVKPLGGPAEIVDRDARSACNVARRARCTRDIEPARFRVQPGPMGLSCTPYPDDCDPACWPIEAGTIRDYAALGEFHYLAGPPAAHKRVWTVRTPARARALGVPEVAAILVVSPPLSAVRGRNLATAGRYCGPDRLAGLALLNREVEWISRVIVHPIHRSCGLAVRLVRHALAEADTPWVESLAVMGAVNPFFERAGMTAYRLGPDEHIVRLLRAAEAVGLSPQQVAAVEPVRQLLGRKASRKAAFLRREIERCIRRTLSPARVKRLADPAADVCRRTARQYVYYLGRAARVDRASAGRGNGRNTRGQVLPSALRASAGGGGKASGRGARTREKVANQPKPESWKNPRNKPQAPAVDRTERTHLTEANPTCSTVSCRDATPRQRGQDAMAKTELTVQDAPCYDVGRSLSRLWRRNYRCRNKGQHGCQETQEPSIGRGPASRAVSQGDGRRRGEPDDPGGPRSVRSDWPSP